MKSNQRTIDALLLVAASVAFSGCVVEGRSSKAGATATASAPAATASSSPSVSSGPSESEPASEPAPPAAAPSEDAVSDRAMETAAGGRHACVRFESGTVKCWGAGEQGQTANSGLPAGDSHPGVAASDSVQVVAGESHTCSLRADHGVECWGDNTQGQMGSSAGGLSAAPVGVPGLSGVRSISSGDAHMCAVTEAGAVLCWGRNDEGSTGDESAVAGDLVTVSTGVSATAIAAGSAHSCALLVDQSVVCWGSNEAGQLGQDLSLTGSVSPVSVSLPTGAVSVVASQDHTCALLADQSGVCWGAGDPSVTAVFAGSVQKLVGGTAGVCGIMMDASVACLGERVASRLVSESGAPVVAISISRDFSVAILSDSSVMSLGSNDYGQLGGGNEPGTTPPSVVSVFEE